MTPERAIPFAEPWLDEACADAAREQILTSFVGPGAACRAFAAELSTVVGRPCVLTTSGTIALTVAAAAIGLRPGDEILVPAYGVISTINAFASAGLVPRLVEIDRSTGCLDPEALERRVTPQTKAVCFVDFAGYTGPALASVAESCSRRGIPLIEDAAPALGHAYGDRSAAAFGTVGTLSFSAQKVVTTGQGGALFAESQEVLDAARRHIDHGDLEWRQTNLNRGIGTNLRFNDVLAAVGLAQMANLPQRLERKRRAHRVLGERLGHALFSLPGDAPPLFNVVFAEDPDRLIGGLRERAIDAVRQYRSLYQHPAYAHLADAAFPNADWWTDHAVYLPYGLSLMESDAERIADAIAELSPRLLRAGTT